MSRPREVSRPLVHHRSVLIVSVRSQLSINGLIVQVLSVYLLILPKQRLLQLVNDFDFGFIRWKSLSISLNKPLLNYLDALLRR